MRINKFALAFGFAIASALFLEVAAHADESDQATKITFSQPIEIPGQVLPAGTYLFKLANSDNMNIIQIFNADGTRLHTTLQAIAAERTEDGTGDTVIVMADHGAERTEALVKWFYAGNTEGHEFVYSKQEKQQLAQGQQRTIIAGD